MIKLSKKEKEMIRLQLTCDNHHVIHTYGQLKIVGEFLFQSNRSHNQQILDPTIKPVHGQHFLKQ